MTRFALLLVGITIIAVTPEPGHGAEPPDGPMPPALLAKLLDDRYSDCRSFDVTVSFTVTRTLGVEMVNGVGPDGKKVQVPKITVTPLEKAPTETRSYRQVFLHRGKSVPPFRRVERFDPKTGERMSVLAFDGTLRRTYYSKYQNGLVAGPPDRSHEYAPADEDYLSVAGFRDLARRRTLAELFSSRARTTVAVDPADPTLIVLHGPPDGKAVVGHNGYKVWLDTTHGMAVRRYEQYELTGEPRDGRPTPVTTDRVEVERFHALPGGYHVPVEFTATSYVSRGESRGLIAGRSHGVVDTAKSNWNVDPDPNLFAFDFPSGARVTDEISGLALVVGDQDAGRNINELIDTAKDKFPIREDARAAAGWDQPARSRTYRVVFILANLLFFLTTVVVYVCLRRRRAIGGPQPS